MPFSIDGKFIINDEVLYFEAISLEATKCIVQDRGLMATCLRFASPGEYHDKKLVMLLHFLLLTPAPLPFLILRNFSKNQSSRQFRIEEGRFLGHLLAD